MRRLYYALLNSLRGLGWALRCERALRQELLLLVAALPLAACLATGPWAFVALIGALLLLLAVEFLNTAIEKLADHVTPEHHPEIGIVKDLGSAAVFVLAAFNVLVWGMALWLSFGA